MCMNSNKRVTLSQKIASYTNNDRILDSRQAKNGDDERELRLMMLACEENEPYGPPLNTAQMFLKLFAKVQQNILQLEIEHDEKKVLNPQSRPGNDPKNVVVNITITIYNCVSMDYPTNENEWNSYDGIILPGSFSAAYDEFSWIQHLKQVIRDEIHAKCRPTLGVCFGHQIFAHAFESDGTYSGGKATKCPSGTQAGPRSFTTTPEGSALLFRHFLYGNNDASDQHALLSVKNGDEHLISPQKQVQLLYTHGDMVETLPDCALTLGGNCTVPIQSAVYFSSSKDAQNFQTLMLNSGNDTITKEFSLPYAFTFQAHPEYITTTDFENSGCLTCTPNHTSGNDHIKTEKTDYDSYTQVLSVLAKEGMIPEDAVAKEKKATQSQQLLIQNDSVNVIMNVARILGWM